MARYTIIAAIDEEGGIGKDGRIPWDCPADRKFFKDTTMGHAIVVGTKTYRTLPALYGRGQGANHAGNPGASLAMYYRKPGQPD